MKGSTSLNKTIHTSTVNVTTVQAPMTVYRMLPNTSFINKEDHDLTPYIIIPDSSNSLYSNCVSDILNNIFYTISPKGFIKHSMEVESSLPECYISRTQQYPGIYQLCLRSTAFHKDRFRFNLNLKCEGIYSHVVTLEEISIRNYVHYLVLLPPVQLISYNYNINDTTVNHSFASCILDTSDNYVVLKVTDTYKYIVSSADPQ